MLPTNLPQTTITHPDAPDTSDAMRWSDAFLLGYDPMDKLHEEFVDIVARLQAADDGSLPSLMDELARHLQEHFDLENKWMEETDFPPRGCHMDEHAAVLKSVAEVREELTAGNTDLCRDLVAHLAEWFPGHADHLDSALAHWMSKRRFGGKPVVLRRDVPLR